MKYLGRKRSTIYLIIVAAIMTTATRLYVPVVIGRIVNSIQERNFNVLSYFVELILILAVVSSIATFIVNFGAQYASQHYAYNLKKKDSCSLSHPASLWYYPSGYIFPPSISSLRI